MRIGSIPIVEHVVVSPTAVQQRAAESLAERLLEEQPDLAATAQWRPFIPHEVDEGPALHLDDLSEIPLVDGGHDVRFLQDRARFRAGEGDLVGSCSDEIEGFEAYCREQLGLARVEWHRPAMPADPLRIAHACWEDRHVRRALVHKLRCGDLAYLHPHMGTFGVWELAALLHGASRRPIHVLAPPPALTAWANDKVQFAGAVSRLFGETFVPRTTSAWSLGMLARRVSELAASAEVFGLKIPNSAGGAGNAVLDSAAVRGRPLHEVADVLRPVVAGINWEGNSPLLIDLWETDVLCSPSAQLWIPPESVGEPVIEGLFVQQLGGRVGEFVGATAAQFPAALATDLATRSWLLGRLFQRMGYLGRCSFDLILVGSSLADCRLEFIECNGRWGGTSLPMTLMNRLFGDWQRQPFAVQVVTATGLDGITFARLTERLGKDLYDSRTGQGRIVLYTPGRMPTQSAVSVLALGPTWTEAVEFLAESVPRRLQEACQGPTHLGTDPVTTGAAE